MTCNYDLNYCDSCDIGYTHDLNNGSSTFGQCIGVRGANCASTEPYDLDFCTSCKDSDYWNLNKDNGVCERRWEKPKKKGLSTGAIIGIAVGCAVVVGLIIFLLVYFLVCRKKSVGNSSSQ